MKKILLAALTMQFLLLCGCHKNPEQVVKDRFPDCFADPMIGQSQGARCEVVGDEWRIAFWRGWGDCPAGCIHKEDYAWYIVDAEGKVYEATEDWAVIREIPPWEKINSSPPSTP